MADVLILNYNDCQTTQELVERIRDYQNVAHICVVDNASPDNSYERLRRNCGDKADVIKTPKNGGYGYGNNYGIRYLHDTYGSEYILLCNPDVIIADEVIGKLEEFLRCNDSYIIAAPFMLAKDGTRQKNTAFKLGGAVNYIMSYGMLCSKIFRPGEYCFTGDTPNGIYNVEAVAGSLFLLDAEKMLKYAMYDENVFLYCEERILGMKCRQANLKIALLSQYTFVHNHSVSINKSIASEAKKRKIMIQSAMYVIKNYYHANAFVILLGRMVLSLSVIEIRLMEWIREKRHRK